MRIKTLLTLSATYLVLSTGIVASIAVFASRETYRIAVQGDTAKELMKQVFELSTLTRSYLENRDERPKAQWQVQFARMEQTVASAAFEEKPGSDFVPVLRDDMSGIKSSFDDLVARPKDGPAARLVAEDLLVKVQRLIAQTDALAKAAHDERTAARSRKDRLILALLALLAACAIAVLYVIYRRIARPLVRLQKGAEVVGKGKLQYKVGMEGSDEIGRLSRAFDDMTAKLKKSYDTLEDKVEERTRQLKEANRKNELLLQSIGDGVIAIDKNWNIIQWNPAASRITGWSEEEAVGRPFRDIVKFLREHDRSENVLFISDAMLSKKVRFMEDHTVVVRKDGSELPVGDSAAPIIADDGDVRGAIITFRDMSREREAQLVRSNYAYAHHQLRTPVTVAAWSIQAALDEKDPAAARMAVANAAKAMQSVSKLTEGLVEVSGLENGMLIPKMAEVNVASLIDEVVSSLLAKAGERRVRLVVEPVPPSVTVAADKKLLGRALQEVISNAIEYGDAESEAHVRVKATTEGILFEIANQGMGIPQPQLGMVFTKFFRGVNVPAESTGAGLGLYIAKEYLKLCKGKIWFESREKEGATFYVSLPA